MPELMKSSLSLFVFLALNLAIASGQTSERFQFIEGWNSNEADMLKKLGAL